MPPAKFFRNYLKRKKIKKKNCSIIEVLDAGRWEFEKFIEGKKFFNARKDEIYIINVILKIIKENHNYKRKKF